MLKPISGQASEEEVEVKSALKSLNYMSLLFNKTSATVKNKCDCRDTQTVYHRHGA